MIVERNHATRIRGFLRLTKIKSPGLDSTQACTQSTHAVITTNFPGHSFPMSPLTLVVGEMFALLSGIQNYPISKVSPGTGNVSTRRVFLSPTSIAAALCPFNSPGCLVFGAFGKHKAAGVRRPVRGRKLCRNWMPSDYGSTQAGPRGGPMSSNPRVGGV